MHLVRDTVCLLLVLIASPAHAAITYSFEFDKPAYTVQPGGKVDVVVYLVEKLELGDSSQIGSYGAGIGDAGVRIGYVTTPAHPATVAALSDIVANAAFNNHEYDAVTPYLTADLTGPGLPNPVAGLLGSTYDAALFAADYPGHVGDWYRAAIGTFKFTGGAVLGEITTIRAGDLFTDRNDTLLFDSTPLDNYGGVAIGDSPIAQITVVPEPGVWVGLAGTVIMGGIIWMIRFRRLRQA
jgi:hypothetical protein